MRNKFRNAQYAPERFAESGGQLPAKALHLVSLVRQTMGRQQQSLEANLILQFNIDFGFSSQLVPRDLEYHTMITMIITAWS